MEPRSRPKPQRPVRKIVREGLLTAGLLLLVLLPTGIAQGALWALRRWLGGRTVDLVFAVLWVAAVAGSIITRRNSFAGWSRLAAPVVGFVAGMQFSPVEVPDTEFYKAAAQVIPVLLLTIVVDKGREFSESPDVYDRLALVVVVASLLAGGVVTFSALAENSAAGHHANVVIASMVCALSALITSLVARAAPTTPPDPGGSDHRAPWCCPRPRQHRLGDE